MASQPSEPLATEGITWAKNWPARITGQPMKRLFKRTKGRFVNFYHHHPQLPIMSIQCRGEHLPSSSRQHLLDEILSTRDTILEYDRTTGATKAWAWCVLSCYYHGGSCLTSNSPRGKNNERIPIFHLVEYRDTHCFEYPCCLCAELAGAVTESAIYIAGSGLYRGFWVASCARELCGYFGEHIMSSMTPKQNTLNARNSAARKLLAPEGPSGKGLSKPQYALHTGSRHISNLSEQHLLLSCMSGKVFHVMNQKGAIPRVGWT
jgi:hypothetical protein